MILETVEDKVAYIRRFCDLFTPADKGQPHWAWLFADFGNGTNCGFLPHRAWYAMGGRESLVNVNLPGCKYRDGKNLTFIWNQGKPPFVNFSKGRIVPECSTVYVSNGPPNTEHVEILDQIHDNGDGTERWEMWAGGQARNSLRKVVRTFTKGGLLLGDRRLIGYLPPSNMRCTAEPMDLDELAERLGIRDLPGRDPFTGEALYKLRSRPGTRGGWQPRPPLPLPPLCSPPQWSI